MRPGKQPQKLEEPATSYVENGMISASAAGFHVTRMNRLASQHRIPAIAVAEDFNEAKQRKIYRISAASFEQSAVIPPSAMLAEHDIAMGDLLRLDAFVPQKGLSISENGNYILPPGCPAVSYGERTMDQGKDRIIGFVSPWNTNDGFGDQLRPLSHLHEEGADIKEPLKELERLYLAAAARAHYKAVEDMSKVSWQGKFTSLGDDSVEFVTESLESEDDYQVQSRLWRPEAVVKVFCPDDDPAKPATKGGRAIGVITAVQSFDETRKFKIQMQLEPVKQSQLKLDPSHAIWPMAMGEEPAVVRFSAEHSGHIHSLNTFRGYRMTDRIQKEAPVARCLTEALGITQLVEAAKEAARKKSDDDWGTPANLQQSGSTPTESERKPYMLPSQYKERNFSFKHEKLNKHQLKTLRKSVNGLALLFQRALAGSGKTQVAAEYAKEVHAMDGETLLVCAPTNDATTNGIDAFHERTEADPDDFLVLTSKSVNRRTGGQSDKPWASSRLAECVDRLLQSEEAKFKEDDRKDLEFYVQKSRLGASINVDDDNALKKYLEYRHPKVIFCTVAMALRMGGKLEPLVTRICLDETGQLPEKDFLTLLATFGNCYSVLFTGDPYQARNGDYTIPQVLLKYGMLPSTEVVKPREIDTEALHTLYRFHPELFKAIMFACYPDEEKLECGTLASDRDYFVRLGLSTDPSALPIIIFNSEAQDKKTATKSRFNTDQTEAACHAARVIRKRLPQATVLIESYYAQQAQDIEDELKDPSITSVTVDKFIGKEADVTIMCLSRYLGDSEEVKETTHSFVVSESRATVAATRPRHMLVIIGHVKMLQINPVWKRLIEYTAPRSPIHDVSDVYNVFESPDA